MVTQTLPIQEAERIAAYHKRMYEAANSYIEEVRKIEKEFGGVNGVSKVSGTNGEGRKTSSETASSKTSTKKKRRKRGKRGELEAAIYELMAKPENKEGLRLKDILNQLWDNGFRTYGEKKSLYQQIYQICRKGRDGKKIKKEGTHYLITARAKKESQKDKETDAA